MPATKNEPNKGEPSPGEPNESRLRIWAMRVALGLGLLLALKIGYDFYNHFYYTEDLPSLWELKNHWNVFRVGELLHDRTLLWRVFPRARVLFFILFMWAVLLLGAAVLVFEYFCYFAARGQRRNRFVFYVRFRNLVLSVSGFGVLCIAYGFYVEPYWLQVNHLKLVSPKISSASGPIRILLFSDLHMGRKLRLEPGLPEVIAEQHPDLIVFAGDAMNSSWALGKFKQFMLRLGDIAPVIVVKGNQDHGPYWDSRNIYSGTRVQELDNQALTIKIRGTELYFWGQPYDPVYLQPSRPAPTSGDYTILLHHGPDLMEDAVRAGFDLYLCGHTHGGQVALPFYGALITYAKYDKRYESGLYHEGSTTLYVNRGIGLAKWPQPEARFFARPEITVIDLVGK